MPTPFPARSPRSFAFKSLAGVLAAIALTLPACAGGEAAKPAVAASEPAAPPAPVLTAREREMNAKSFDYVWQTVHDRHWDPTLGGLDWDAVKTELRPKVEQAASMDEARGVMRDALARLGQSHFSIIDREAYEAVAPAPHAARDTQAAGAAITTGDTFNRKNPGEHEGERDLSGDGQTGLEIRIADTTALVTAVESDSAAARAGIKPGWVVQSVDGKLTGPIIESLSSQFQGKEAFDAMVVRGIEARFRGQPGEVVRATFLDEHDQTVEKQIALSPPTGEFSQFGNLPPVHVQFSSTRLPGNVGYIRFNYFLDPAFVMPKFTSAMESFYTADGIILDLRGNPGGIGFMASGIGGFFVDKDGLKLGEMRTRETTVSFVIFPRVQVYGGPLAILIDSLSISTSEIMAGGMQDIGRARVFGVRSAGAALPSLIEKLPNGDGFQFVVANYTSASGRVLEGKGVSPDEEVRPDRATLLAGKDPVVEAALRWIRSQSARLR